MNIRPTRFAPLVLLPVSLFAQDSTVRGNATPFHKGQWAAQFQAGTSFGSLGFIKFRSPTHALVLDLRIGGGHSEFLTTDSSGANRFAELSSSASLQARFGWRRYAGAGNGTKVVSHYSLGVLAGFNHSLGRGLGGGSQQNGWTVGAFGDVGGTYLLTPNFGVGALATAAFSYDNSLAKTSSGAKSRTWSIGGSAVGASLVATLFF